MKTVLLGLALLIAGVTLSLLMVIRVVEPSFVLSFLAYGASLIGLFLGVLFAARHAGGREPGEDHRDSMG
jgi:hypothetical protein